MARRWGEIIAEFEVDPGTCRLHAEGWQSWTPTTSYCLSDTQLGPVHPETWTSGYGGSRPRPPKRAGVFQGDGLLVVDPGTGDDVMTIGALSADLQVPVIRCEQVGLRRVQLSADLPVSVTRSESAAGLDGAKVAFADRLAAVSGVGPLRSAPTIWCSWYQYFAGVTEADIDENIQDIAKRDLPVDVIQLDDGYQREMGDWLKLSDRFESLPGMVERILASNRRAGIWIAPFLAGARSDVAADHPEWLVRADSGAPVVAVHNWGQDTYPLDVTHPDVQAYLNSIFRWFTDIGIDFFKVDFVYAAALDGRRYNNSLTSVEVYRHGLTSVRSAIGPDAYLLGCGAPLLPSIGKVDGMRVSADTAPLWAAEQGDLSLAGGESAELSTHSRAYQHGRYWVNDPDCVLLRPGIERRERRARMVQQHGGLRGFSDRVADLDGWGLNATRDLLASVPAPTPFDMTGGRRPIP
jgi:alpha-galactosidase